MRFPIIDGIRGHLLVGMLVAHFSFVPGLAYWADFHHVRLIGLWDAEFFIPVSGFLVGYLYAAKASLRDRFLRFTGQRLAVIYRWYLVASVPFLALALPGMQLGETARTLLGVGLVQAGGSYSSILPIYMYCFGFLALLAPIGRRFGAGAVTVASGAVYLASHATYGGGFFGASGDFVVFDVAAWQFPFVLAFWIGTRHADWGRAIAAIPASAYYGLVAVLAVALVATRGTVIDWTPILPDENALGLWTRFDLHPWYLFRITMACALLALLATRTEPLTRPVSALMRWYLSLPFLRAIGRQSIQMFTLHVYLVALLAVAAPRLEPVPLGAFALALLAVFIAAPHVGRFVPRRATPSSA